MTIRVARRNLPGPLARARAPRAMTLVEVLLSFAILVVGLVSIFAVLNAGVRSHKRAINEMEAAQVAESIMAEMRADFSHGRVPHSDGPTIFHESKDYSGYSYSKNILALDPRQGRTEQRFSNQEYFVRLQVRWSDRGENKSISVDTIMFCNRANK